MYTSVYIRRLSIHYPIAFVVVVGASEVDSNRSVGRWTKRAESLMNSALAPLHLSIILSVWQMVTKEMHNEIIFFKCGDIQILTWCMLLQCDRLVH